MPRKKQVTTITVPVTIDIAILRNLAINTRFKVKKSTFKDLIISDEFSRILSEVLTSDFLETIEFDPENSADILFDGVLESAYKNC